jgi:hypothetical protein
LPLNWLKKAQAFNVTGVDFAGPLYYEKDPKKQDTDEDYMAEDGSYRLYKCYVCLFTCAVTRAVHLELVPDAPSYWTFDALPPEEGRCLLCIPTMPKPSVVSPAIWTSYNPIPTSMTCSLGENCFGFTPPV